MEEKERRLFGRVAYPVQAIAVVCDTQQVIRAGVRDIGPGGVGLILPEDTPELLGKDMILITDTVIMYVDVIRQEQLEDGSWRAGLSARKFSGEVMQYLLDSIELRSKQEEGNQSESI